MQQIRQQMNVTEWGLLLLLSVFWGGSFFFVEIIIVSVSPLLTVLSRVGLAALALWLIALFRGITPPRDLKIWGAFLVMGLINNVIPFSLIIWGQLHITSGLASILNATTPLFTVAVAGIFLADEKITWTKALALLIGFLGVVVLLSPSGIGSIGEQSIIAQLAVLVAAASYGFASVFGRRFRATGLPHITIVAGQVTGSTIWMIPLVALFSPLPAPDSITPAIVACILALALFSTAWAYMIYFRILASSGALNIMLVTFLVPVSAILAGVLILNEKMLAEHYIGMVIIGIALAIMDGRAVQFLRRKFKAAPPTHPGN